MLERRHMTRKQYLLTFPSPSTLSRWFQLIEGGMILLHLTTCTVVLLDFSLFSPNTMTWYFPLVTIFLNALPSELQAVVQLGVYVFPDLSTLLNSTLQEQKL